VADLRKQLDALSNQTASVTGAAAGAASDQAVPPQVEAVPVQPSNTTAAAETRLAEAKAQLNQAVSAAQRSQLLEADAILELLQADHPRFPARLCRAGAPV
jgi:hypothetical protein